MNINFSRYIQFTVSFHIQIGNASAMKEAQQMQMRGNSWQVSDNTPNPWVTATGKY